MARFLRTDVYQAMLNTGIIPVFYHSDVKTAKHVVKACYDGGIRVLNSLIEVTLHTKCLEN